MLQFEKGSLGGILAQKKLGIAITGYQLEKAQSRDKYRILNAEQRIKKAKKLFDEAKDVAKSKEVVEEEPADPGYGAGTWDVPAPVGRLSEVKATTSPAAACFVGGYVAMSYPGGIDVAFVHRETDTQVDVQYLRATGLGAYSLFDPPYEEMRDKSQIIMGLSWPHPKGFTLRELKLLLFKEEELDSAMQIWRESRTSSRRR